VQMVRIGVAVLLWAQSINGVADTAVERLQGVLNGLGSLSAEFVQTRLDLKTGGAVVDAKGQMALQRPNRFRWTYQIPYEQIIVADGERVWFYDIDLEQVSVRSLADSMKDSPAAILVGNEPLAQRFHVTQADTVAEVDWFSLQPKVAEGGYVSLEIGIRGKVLVSLRMVDEFGRHTELKFSSVKRNPTIGADHFTFVPPDGVDVVGMESTN